MPADIRAIKKRIKSIESTLHITNAMQLVASSKIRRATSAFQAAKDYADAFRSAYSSLITKDSKNSVYLKERGQLPRCYIVVAADRGLAGGYNGNIFRLCQSVIKADDFVLPIGKRACDFCRRKYKNVLSYEFVTSEKITDSEIASVSSSLIDGFRNARYGTIEIISTRFVSVITQDASLQQLLPLEITESGTSSSAVFEPDPVTVMNYAINSYLTALICDEIRQSYLCELYARRNAMDSASENAEEMINDLSLAFNRARQSSITQEITEIVAGAEDR